MMLSILAAPEAVAERHPSRRAWWPGLPLHSLCWWCSLLNGVLLKLLLPQGQQTSSFAVNEMQNVYHILVHAATAEACQAARLACKALQSLSPHHEPGHPLDR